MNQIDVVDEEEEERRNGIYWKDQKDDLDGVTIRVVPNWVKFHLLIYLSPLHKCPRKEGFLTSWGVKSNKKPCRQNYRVAMGIFLLP